MKKRTALLMFSVFSVFALAGCGKQHVEQTDVPETVDKGDSASVDVDLSELIEETVIGDYSKIPVDASPTEVTDEDVEAALENYMDYAASYEHVTEGVVEDGDTVNIHFTGRMNGEEFDGGTGEDNLTIGSNTFISGFEEGLVGTKIGDTVTLDLTFPENYEESLAGKDVEFEVTVNYKNGDKIEPELTDSFVKENFGFDTVSALKDDIRLSLETQNAQNYEYEVNDLVFRYVEGNSKIPAIPMPYIEDYVKDAKLYYLDYARQNGIEGDDYIEQLTGISEEEFDEQAKQSAEDYYRQEVLINALAKDMGLQVTDEEFEAYLEEQAQEYMYEDKEALRQELEDNGMVEIFREEILHNKVFEELRGNII